VLYSFCPSWSPRVNSHSAIRTTLLSPLALTVANSAPNITRKRWPITALKTTRHLPEINKPHARIPGVVIPMSYPIDSNTCIEVTSGHLHSCTDSLRITWFWIGLYRFIWVDTWWMESAEHTPLSWRGLE
jgi:hypothetical protein